MANLPGPSLEVNDDGIPVVYDRAWKIYDYMLSNIEESVFEDTYQQYKGKITEEVEAELSITPSQYSRCINLLKLVGSVQQVGRSNEGSHWILLFRPTQEDFESTRTERYHSRRRPSKIDITQQRIKDLTTIVSSHEDRITHLEHLLERESRDGED